MPQSFQYQFIKSIQILICFGFLFLGVGKAAGQTESHIRKRFEIVDGLSPKSIITNGNGIFSAQNMMYRHTVTLINQSGEKIANIPDAVNLWEFGFKEYSNQLYRGAPVEGVFTNDGNYLWVSNYQMTGPEFKNPGCDLCIGKTYDPSFLYKINTQSHKIENIIKVGSVPKFLAISDNGKLLIASNWVSSDISIIDLEKEQEIKRVKVGSHPRGIAISKDAKKAFVTIMGSTKIAAVNLVDYSVTYIEKIGKAPRSILLADGDSTLYISVNSSNTIVKINRYSNQRVVCKTPSGPRSITISPDENSLYVVNYFDDSFSKISTDSMKIEATISTGSKPIGICGDWKNGEIWVSCYSGKIEIFRDFKLNPPMNNYLGWDLSSLVTKSISEESDLKIDSIQVASHIPKEKDLQLLSKSKEVHSIQESTEDCHYFIIIDAFSVYENAVKRKAEIDAQNYAGKIIEGKLNYVSIACFDNRTDAEKQRLIIRTTVEGCESAWILKR